MDRVKQYETVQKEAISLFKKKNKTEKSIEIERIVEKNKEENEVYFKNLKTRLETKYKNEIENLEGKIEELRQKNQNIFRYFNHIKN